MNQRDVAAWFIGVLSACALAWLFWLSQAQPTDSPNG